MEYILLLLPRNNSLDDTSDVVKWPLNNKTRPHIRIDFSILLQGSNDQTHMAFWSHLYNNDLGAVVAKSY